MSGMRWMLLLLLIGCRTTSPPPSVPSPAPDEPTWTWTGLEYFGPTSLSREALLDQQPFVMGTQWQEHDVAEVDAWCAEFAEQKGIAYHHCSTLRYVDGRAFVLIDFAEELPSVRDAPQGDSVWPEPAISETWDRIVERRRELFEAQDFDALQESFEPGWLTWADPELAEWAAELGAATPVHREALTSLVNTASDADVRARAANLLNYAGDHAQSVQETLEVLTDPDAVVRNDLTRYLLHAATSLEDEAARLIVARALADQARRPTMSDRNKALYALWTLAKQDWADRQALLDVAAPVAEDVAERSILPNVGGAARSLLSELGAPPPRPHPGSVPQDPTENIRPELDAYLAAFNAHDPAVMKALCHPKVEVWYVDDGGVSALGTAGAAVLASELEGYFAGYPDVRSTPADITVLDGWAWFTERVSWGDSSQASPAVYQFEEGLLRRAWYLPVIRD